MEEPKLEFEHYEDLDVLDWWKIHKHRFPDVALMASDLLSIPIIIVASESLFSVGGHVLNKYRSCLLPKKVQALIYTHSWLHGFSPSGKTFELKFLWIHFWKFVLFLIIDSWFKIIGLELEYDEDNQASMEDSNTNITINVDGKERIVEVP